MNWDEVLPGDVCFGTDGPWLIIAIETCAAGTRITWLRPYGGIDVSISLNLKDVALSRSIALLRAGRRMHTTGADQ